MYRVLRAADQVHERRRQATHPTTVKPELLATRPKAVVPDIARFLVQVSSQASREWLDRHADRYVAPTPEI